ncbi:hypothetical protein T02_566 [Trichinella nativa]|uniref:Uncharacterized protein n=1 Tax=Trichinella nativa TaxID=6335 RepID=A0A0V1L6Y5_9BILA|nr:hypothetical protein T02_566 [Trichinella nativa]
MLLCNPGVSLYPIISYDLEQTVHGTCFPFSFAFRLSMKQFCNYKFLISSWLHCVQCIVRILYSTSTDHVYNRSIENER